MTDPIIYRCPAKVNAALSVGAPPSGGGYHPIVSWMVAVDLYDDLIVTRRERQRAESIFDIAWAGDAPCPSPIDWPLEKDLVYRAHRLLEREAGKPLPVDVRLRKRIAAGAGLAGGSSDAATMLMTCDELFDLNLPTERLMALAGELGSDIAFFFGDGSAVVTGRGEALRPARLAEPIHLCLIMPSFGCDTGAVYRKFDELRPGAAVDEGRVLAALAGEGAWFNDLADAACAVQPDLAKVRAQVSGLTGRDVHVTGSGSGLFIVASDGDDAKALSEQVEVHGVVARAVQTIGM